MSIKFCSVSIAGLDTFHAHSQKLHRCQQCSIGAILHGGAGSAFRCHEWTTKTLQGGNTDAQVLPLVGKLPSCAIMAISGRKSQNADFVGSDWKDNMLKKMDKSSRTRPRLCPPPRTTLSSTRQCRKSNHLPEWTSSSFKLTPVQAWNHQRNSGNLPVQGNSRCHHSESRETTLLLLPFATVLHVTTPHVTFVSAFQNRCASLPNILVTFHGK